MATFDPDARTPLGMLARRWSSVEQMPVPEATDLFARFVATCVPPNTQRAFARSFNSPGKLGSRFFRHIKWNLPLRELKAAGLAQADQSVAADVLYGRATDGCAFRVAGTGTVISDLFVLEVATLARVGTGQLVRYFVYDDCTESVFCLRGSLSTAAPQ